VDGEGVLHGGDDAQPAATAGTGEDVEVEHAAQQGRPGPRARGAGGAGAGVERARAGLRVRAAGRVVEVWCGAHARRYFFDAKASDPARAPPALGFIQQLYAVEREVKDATAVVRRAPR